MTFLTHARHFGGELPRRVSGSEPGKEAPFSRAGCRRRLAPGVVVLAGALLCGGGAAKAATCPVGERGAAAALAACLDRAAPGEVVALPPGRHALDAPLRIARPVTIRTAGLSDASARCDATADARCATLVLAAGAAPEPGGMPVEITAPHVTLSHVRIVGSRGLGAAGDPARDRATCLSAPNRPAGGGLRVSAPDFSLIGAVLRDVACYSALEVTRGSDRLVVRNSFIGHNGDHHPGTIWADGLTVHEVRGARITGNLFSDNTDVQLILGGCVGCTVRGNAFRHDGGFAGSSFAELMLHAWPDSSGDYTGSVVSGNDIDCGLSYRCGFGMMLGSEPWYRGRAFGGTVRDNVVRHAMMGLDIDGLTGPVTVRGNRIGASGGTFPARCGVRAWPAVNVAPASRRWLRGGQAAAGAVSTAGCILNQEPAAPPGRG